MKAFKAGSKVVICYPGGMRDSREIGRVFRDGSFRLLGGFHRFNPSGNAGNPCATRANEPSIICELEETE